MYAQTVLVRVPMGKMADFRRLVEAEYLPALRQRPGFLAAYLMEQVDDLERAELVQFWDNQAAVENFHKTGTLEGSVQSIASQLPGVQIQRQGYIVRVTAIHHPEADTVRA
jgi:quinol monooxygenase YgiN